VLKIDPRTGAVLKTIASDRFVTGVTWTDGELWHGTWEGDASDLRRVDPDTGRVLERIEMPAGARCSGVEADDQGRLWCGDGATGKLRAVRRGS
jgi:streptogramin lyase